MKINKKDKFDIGLDERFEKELKGGDKLCY